jgi:hypothetical protein
LRLALKSTQACSKRVAPVDREEADELGERLVEPQVVPPAHRHEVAEPHVRHLVRDDHAPRRRLSSVVRLRKTNDSENVTAPGFSMAPALNSGRTAGRRCRRTGSGGRTAPAEVQALRRHLEQLGGVGVEVGRQRAPAVQTEVDAVVRSRRGVPGPARR